MVYTLSACSLVHSTSPYIVPHKCDWIVEILYNFSSLQSRRRTSLIETDYLYLLKLFLTFINILGNWELTTSDFRKYLSKWKRKLILKTFHIPYRIWRWNDLCWMLLGWCIIVFVNFIWLSFRRNSSWIFYLRFMLPMVSRDGDE